jgi:membrane carboxypeptidase/penicillin-binding protein PbpC
VESLISFLHKLGVTTLNDPTRYDLSITLGGGEVRLIDLAAAYSAFANGGYAIRPSMILEVRDKNGQTLYQWQPPPSSDPVIDPRVTFLINDILSDNEARLPGFGSHSALLIGRPAAAKTGTTTDFRDNWTVGYTPNLVVGVWVGNANNTPMTNVSGVTGAGPIWNEFMREVLKGQPELPFERPAGLTQVEVCAASGLLPTQYCPQRRVEWFIQGTAPTEYDSIYQKFTIDRVTGKLATDDTPPNRRLDKVYKVLPQEARDWGLRHGIEPPPVSVHTVSTTAPGVRLLTPDPYTIYQLTPVTPFETQKIRFSAAVSQTTTAVTYLVDNQPVETVNAEPWTAWWALTPGQHTLKAVATLADGTTETSEAITFSVNGYVAPDEQPASGDVK